MRGRRAKQQLQKRPAPPSPWRPCARKTQTLRARPVARQSHKPPNRARCQVSRPSDRPFITHRPTSLPFSAAARAPFCLLHQSVERMASRLMRERQNQAQPDEQSCAYSDDDLDQNGRLSLGKLSRRQQALRSDPDCTMPILARDARCEAEELRPPEFPRRR